MERDTLAYWYLDMTQTTELVTDITKMFIETDLFGPEFAASEQAQMMRYLSMLKIDIRDFVSAQHYSTHVELQDVVRR